MTKLDRTTAELFLSLGATPQRRRAAADKLFRRLRRADEERIALSFAEPPRQLAFSALADER